MAERKRKSLTWRGYLLHLTHYDPVWWKNKPKEKPFDLELGLRIVDALAEQRFNMLLIGVSDGVRYRSHPEWRRHYSQPMSVLRKLVERARKAGMEIVPKLNFSRSEINTHNHWMRAAGQSWHAEFDDAAYWRKAFEAVDEVIDVCRPERYFHVGMDEDHDRSYTQYIEAIKTLRQGLRQRGLRTVCWSDSAVDYPTGHIHREKSLAAELSVPRDTVRLLWNYWAVPKKEMRTIRQQGFELWGAPGARTIEQATQFRDALLECGGKALVMTHWIPCVKANRKALLERIETFGPVYSA